MMRMTVRQSSRVTRATVTTSQGRAMTPRLKIRIRTSRTHGYRYGSLTQTRICRVSCYLMCSMCVSQRWHNAYGQALDPTHFILTKAQMNEIDHKITALKPPTGIGKLPPLFLHYGQWTASQKIFLITKLIPIIFQSYLSDQCRDVLFRFSHIVTTMLSCPIDPAILPQLETDIKEWLVNLELYFPATELSLVFHLFLKVPDCIKTHGPLTQYWAMLGERFIGRLMRGVKNRSRPAANISVNYVSSVSAVENRRDVAQIARQRGQTKLAEMIEQSSELSAVVWEGGRCKRRTELKGAVNRWKPESVQQKSIVRQLDAILKSEIPRYKQLYDQYTATPNRPQSFSQFRCPGMTIEDGLLTLGPILSTTCRPRCLLGDMVLRSASAKSKQFYTSVNSMCIVLVKGEERVAKTQAYFSQSFAGKTWDIAVITLFKRKARDQLTGMRLVDIKRLEEKTHIITLSNIVSRIMLV